ncbi:ABC transporter substrate-binding protein [Shigella flexneri]
MAFEAFKAGAIDLRTESSAKNWATRYIGKNFANGYIVKDEQKTNAAQDTRWLAFNIQRPVFYDRRVREAVTLAFDFEWMNKALFTMPIAAPAATSRTPNTPPVIIPTQTSWAAGPAESGAAARSLHPGIRTAHPTGTGSTGRVCKAGKLLDDAGWVLKDQQRVNAQDR